MFAAENISKSFRLKSGQKLAALRQVSFGVRPGGLTALVGPDGSGKSTLLRLAAGLLRPDGGRLVFDGQELSQAREDLRAQIGYMPQKFGLYEDLSVQENLDLYADLKGVGPDQRQERYRELLAMSALQPFRQRLAGQLSGGMKQKLGLICTLIAPPKLLLLDEPTVGVDPLSRRELWDIVQGLSGGTGMSVLLSTAYLDEASRCDEVVLLFQGESLARGAPAALRQKTEGLGYLARPAAGDTPRSLQARLLDAPGVIDAVPQGGAVRLVHGRLDPAEQAGLLERLNGADLVPTPASLEDSFMLLLRQQAGPAKGQEPARAAASILQPGPPPARSALPGRKQAEPIIETRQVSRFFGNFVAVDEVSFSVYPGEVFGLLGPNGAGKITTFRMLCGLLPASQGTLRVAGVDVRQARQEARRRLGYVAQKFSLYGPLSVRENLEFFAGAYGLRGQRKSARIREVVEEFSLQRQLHQPAASLPGGYKQRLAMAVGLLHQPAILFLDEPTSGADPLARRDFWKRISGLAEQGVTIVVTTHFMEEAEYCDRILIQDSGRMLALGTPREIRAQAAQAAQSGQFAQAGQSARKAGQPDHPDQADQAERAERAEEPLPSMEEAFIAIVARARASAKERAA